MKRFMFFVTAAVMLMGSVSQVSAQQATTPPHGTDGIHLVVPYAEFEGRPLTLVTTRDRDALVCIEISSDNEMSREEALRFLAREIRLRFATLREQLVGREKVFVFDGSYPFWIPISVPYKGGRYECVLFAENVKVVGNLISAEGQSEKGPGYRPPDY